MPNETSLRDELSAGFDGAGEDPSAVDTGEPAAALTEGANPPAPGASGELPPLEPPSHWPEADRGLFGKAPRDIQQHWLDRDKRYSQGFDKVSKEAAQLKRDREAYDEIFRDMDQQLGLSGMSRQQFVSQLVQWNNYLSKDPAGAMRAMAERMGVDLKTLIEDAPAQDPQISGVRKEVETLKQQLTSQQRARQEETFRSNLTSVERFATAAGQDGKPLHPHFDEVAGDVIQLIRAGERDLEVAYNKAVRMNDKVWEKVQAESAQAKKAQEEAERKQRVDTARRAAVGTSGESTGTTQSKSLRDDLESAFASWPN